jgi:trigger factor
VKLSVERKPASLVVLDITADDDEFAEAMTKAYRKVSKDVQLPGFRKGKAPRSMIERFYGREVFLREAADEVMDKLYRQAIEQESITPVGEPAVEINELEPVNFVVTVPVYPTIAVNDYASVRVEPVDAGVTDHEVEEVLERLRRSQSEWVTVEETRTPGEGDQVTVDYEVMLGDEPFQDPVVDAVFVLGETNLLAQLREKLESMKVGETESFELSFDEDDETADPTIRGKSLAYTVTLKELKQRDLLPLDDDFAMKVNETATLDELREQIRTDIHSGKTNDARTSVVNQIVNAMAEQAEIDPPSVMVDEEVEHQLSHLKEDLQRSGTPWEGYLRLQDKTEDDLKEELRPEAERRLRNSLFLQEVARQETVEVTDDDIEAEITRMSGLGASLGDEASAQSARMAELYRSDYFKNMLRNQLYEQKLTDRLIEIATEGQGAVLNAYVAPEPVAPAAAADTDATEPTDVSETEAADTPEAEAITEAEGTTDAVTEPEEVPLNHTTVEAGEAPSTEDASAISGEAITLSGETGSDVPEPQAMSATTPAESAEVEAVESGTAGTGESKYEGAVEGDGTNNVPEGYPIKGNDSSKIYHVPGGGSYENTVAEYYFATPEDAEAAGFRAAKR